MQDVTLIITSCNRPSLLNKTLESFLAYNTYPIYETYIIDDSGVIDCNEHVIDKYKEILKITSIYNSSNIGQIPSIDKVYSQVKTNWIFHCEEDWEFIQSGFIEKSFNVFEENPTEKIYTVWLRPHNDTSHHPINYDAMGRGYYEMNREFSYTLGNTSYKWCGMTFNPGLRRRDVCMLFHPYSVKCNSFECKNKTYVGEYEVNQNYAKLGYYSMILADPKGHVRHIGWNDHIKRPWEY